MSFKEFRDLLVLLYGDEIISNEEFLLLYNSFISKNPDFPHENYQRFDLDSMNSAECKAEFRVEKPIALALLQPSSYHRCLNASRGVFAMTWKAYAYSSNELPTHADSMIWFHDLADRFLL